MKHAILDLGTNTFLLLIVEAESDLTFKILHQSKRVVKLGQGGIGKNHIQKPAFKRGVQALLSLKKTIQKFEVSDVHAFATSAIRSADNGLDFVRAVNSSTGIEIQVIKGEEEAELIYLGVRQCVNLDEQPVLIMDIGGGSIEFILCNETGLLWKHSYNIGVARLLERFSPSDPITEDQIQLVESYLDNQLSDLSEMLVKYPVTRIIGSAGSFESYTDILGFRNFGKALSSSLLSYEFDLKQYFDLHNYLIQSTRSQRQSLKGLLRMRVDMIVLASIVANFVMKKYSISRMQYSAYSLKEGALWNSLRRKS